MSAATLTPGQAAVLRALGEKPRTGPEIAAETGRSNSSAHQILTALRAKGLVDKRLNSYPVLWWRV